MARIHRGPKKWSSNKKKKEKNRTGLKHQRKVTKSNGKSRLDLHEISLSLGNKNPKSASNLEEVSEGQL